MIRSLLYVPADSERFVARAHERGADAVILDLEDAVIPARKTMARAALEAAVPSVGRAGAAVFVRINEGDLADAEAACRAGAAALLVPKVQSADTLHALAAALAPIEAAAGRAPTQFVPLLEDPGAVLDARPILAGPRILGVAVGGEDLATAMDAEPGPELLRVPKLMVHLAAKAAGVLSFGLLRSIADFADLDGVRAAALEARALGFDGASCIHPSVVPVLNAAFAPSADALDRARRMLDMAERTGAGAFTFEGRMVDRPILDRARRLLARAPREPSA